MEMLAKYESAVVKNLTKSMDKIRNMYPEMKSTVSSYDEVSAGIYEWHKDNELEVFTTGNSINDSRGRAISSALSKVANPISQKDFRACLIIPT
jgi:Flp pilus assembly protein TadB